MKLNDFVEILLFLYAIVGFFVGGTSLGGALEDGLTKGRLIMIILFLPQTIVVGFVFLLVVGITWVLDEFKYGNHKLSNWWNSPIRKGDK